MKKHLSLWIIVLVVASFTAQNAYARHGGKGFHDGRIMALLDLTPEQQQQIDQLRIEHFDKMKKDKDTMRDARSQLRDLLSSDASDEVLIKQFQKMQTIRNTLATERFQHILTVRKILTPEQRKKFDELKKDRKRRGPPPEFGPRNAPPPPPPAEEEPDL